MHLNEMGSCFPTKLEAPIKNTVTPKKVLAQDLTGVDGRKVRIGRRAAKLALVIIGHLDVVGVAVDKSFSFAAS